MKESQSMENLMLDVHPGDVKSFTPALRVKGDELSPSLSPDLTPTALVLRREAEHNTTYYSNSLISPTY